MPIIDNAPSAAEKLLSILDNAIDHGTITDDLVIDLSEGGAHIVTMGAIKNISFENWESLITPDGELSPCTLLVIDGDLFEPTWSDRNQIATAPTYTADFATWFELASLVNGEIYNMWQVSADQRSILGPELVDDPIFADSANYTESGNMAVTGGQLVLTAATAETTVETAPIVAVATAVYLVKTVIDEVTIAGGGVKVNIGSADGAVHTTVGTKYDVITAVDTDGLEIIAAGAAITADINSISVKRLF